MPSVQEVQGSNPVGNSGLKRFFFFHDRDMLAVYSIDPSEKYVFCKYSNLRRLFSSYGNVLEVRPFPWPSKS